jgi:hypothetical protein
MRVIKWIGLKPSVTIPEREKAVTVYGFHSLRHSFASHCAEAGVAKAVAQSILGSSSEIIDKYYVHIGEDAQAKAMDAISFENDDVLTPQAIIDKALKYIEELEQKSDELKALEKILKG